MITMTDKPEDDTDTDNPRLEQDTCAPAQVAQAQSVTNSNKLCKQSNSQGNDSDTIDTTAGDKEVVDTDNTETEPVRPKDHVVADRETVTSIAAMYDITPSELVQTNKLGMSRMVFPGQVLRIPSPPPPPPPPKAPAPDTSEVEIVEYQFIKLRVRHITSGRGVVGGSVLFTPNAIIFDPDPKDPLVEELEPEAFQIIAPMEFVVNAAIFYDFFPLGSTGTTVGREHPPSEIFNAPSDKNKSKPEPELQRQETTESSYSLCQEETEISHKENIAADKDAATTEDAVKSDDNGQSIMGDKATSTTESQEQRYTTDLNRIEPYYLRLTMGKPVNREVSRSTPIMAYGRQTMWPEYWFIVPTKQILNLYKFFNCWFPEIYGPFDLEEIHEMGMELVPEPELDLLEEASDDIGSMNTASHSRHMIHKTMTLNSIDTDLFLPEMSSSSQLFSDDQRKLLYRHIPPRVQGHTWTLAFSTNTHGFSLASLYRRLASADTTPVLLVIQDTDHAVFGACISQPPQLMPDKFVGTGESWLFTFFPSFKVYPWTGENNYIMRSGNDNLIIGSSEGRFGLWLDENFNVGRSQSVTTFDNKPLPGKEDFTINNVECWTFG